MLFSSKTDLTNIAIVGNFNCLFNSKSSSESNLIFMKSLPYSPVLLSFMASMTFFIPSQRSVNFFNTSLFLSAGSKSFHFYFYFNMFNYFTNHQIKRIYTINILIVINIFNCDASNAVNTNTFKRLFVNF